MSAAGAASRRGRAELLVIESRIDTVAEKMKTTPAAAAKVLASPCASPAVNCATFERNMQSNRRKSSSSKLPSGRLLGLHRHRLPSHRDMDSAHRPDIVHAARPLRPFTTNAEIESFHRQHEPAMIVDIQRVGRVADQSHLDRMIAGSIEPIAKTDALPARRPAR